MIGAIVGALLGAVSLSTLLDSIAGTNITAWFFEKVGSVLLLFLSPLLDLFFLIFDSFIDLVKNIVQH